MKNFFKLSLVLVMVSTLAVSCNSYEKMAKNASDITVVCTPEVLALNNGKVPVDLSIEVPANYFKKNFTLRITPVLAYMGGEFAAEPFYVQGTKVDNNYKVVDFSKKTVIEEQFSFDYEPEMLRSKLQLRIEVLRGSENVYEYFLLDPSTMAPITMVEMETLAADPTSQASMAILSKCGVDIADGVNTLQNDLSFGTMMQPLKNNYKRITTSVEKNAVKLNINNAEVEPWGNGISDISRITAYNAIDDRTSQKLYAQGYASPDGPESFNDQLSKARSEAAKGALNELLESYGVEIDAAAYGEDWDGFKELVENSNIEDKNIILQVLNLNESSAKREAEIKNLSEIFGELKTEILPELRRAKLTNEIEVVGKSDAEMLALVNEGRIVELEAEEALYICDNLSVTDEQEMDLMFYAARVLDDARAYNNLGILYSNAGKGAEAVAALKKAEQLACSNIRDVVSQNLTLANIAAGNITSTGYVNSNTTESKASYQAAHGDYVPLSKTSGYNAAVAHTQLGNYTAAKSALNGDKSSRADYLRAVIASKEGDIKTSATSLTAAIKANKYYAAKAENDVNLKNLFEAGYIYEE